MSSGTRSAAIEAMHGLRDEQEEAFQESLRLDREKQEKAAEAGGGEPALRRRQRLRGRRRRGGRLR